MSLVLSVNDEVICNRISVAERRIIFVGPGISNSIARALKKRMDEQPVLRVTFVVDPDQEACRLGYGDVEGLLFLMGNAGKGTIEIGEQKGLRIGLLVTDGECIIYTPTPRAVESERATEEPNGIQLSGGIIEDVVEVVGPRSKSAIESPEGTLQGDPAVPLLGKVPLDQEALAETLEALKKNPPVPFDLSKITRVFSSKFQFVEFEVRGAEWTERELTLSSDLLNADLGENAQAMFETRIKPFSNMDGIGFEVPVVVEGEIAYTRERKRILKRKTQADIKKLWKEIKDRYLRNLPKFGWLISRAEKECFKREVACYQEILTMWVSAFREKADQDEDNLVKEIAATVKGRIDRSTAKTKLDDAAIDQMIRSGLKGIRIIDPHVKLVYKNITPESISDGEFLDTLKSAFNKQELKEWYEVFDAAMRRDEDVSVASA